MRTLGEPYFTDDIAELGTKDSKIQLSGVWIVEIAELDSMSKASVTSIKAFMSTNIDHYRPPYARQAIKVPRQCVFAGTVNHSDYLKDETGNRRFWPVACGMIEVEALARDKDQLIAEAVARYRQGEIWWIDDPVVMIAAEAEQAKRLDVDPWLNRIEEFLQNRDSATIENLMDDCLQIPVADWKQSDRRRVAQCLANLGWKQHRVRAEGGKRQYTYTRTQPEEAFDIAA